MTLLQAIKTLPTQYKQVYFMWRHGLQNTRTDYSKITKEDFIKDFMYGNTTRFENLKLWENTEEYARLVYLMLSEQGHNEILDIYQAVSEKAKQGDDKAIKTLLMLQKEIKSKLKKAEPVESEHDDLI